MSENTKIEWTDATFNPWIGCTKVSPACEHCYAEVSTPARTLGVTWGAKEERRRTSPGNWKLPLRWNAQHEEFFATHWRRRRVFCASLADVFDNAVDPAWRVDLVELIAETPNLDWLILTKRIGNASTMWPAEAMPNVWLGATICSQEEADRDIPKLLATPAAVRFLSMEPLLGPVDLERHLWKCCGLPIPGHPGDGWMQPPDPPECCDDRVPVDLLHWVIVGGESGANARPMSPGWACSLRDQCSAAGVPYFMKQMGGNRDKRGALLDLPYDLRIREFPHG
jgi:protein gp37